LLQADGCNPAKFAGDWVCEFRGGRAGRAGRSALLPCGYGSFPVPNEQSVFPPNAKEADIDHGQARHYALIRA